MSDRIEIRITGLDKESFDRLQKIATKELRTPTKQAEFFIREAINRYGEAKEEHQ